MSSHGYLRNFVTQSSALAALLAALAAAPGDARAENITEVGEGGSEQMARGGAWLARATDPNAAYYNPAGLAGQDTRLSASVNLIMQHTCFTRVLAANDTTAEPSVGSNALFPRVCNDIAPFPDPQVAFNYRVTKRLGISLAIMGPNASGLSRWPEFVNGSQPAPQRYLLLKSAGLTLNPTLGVGYEIADGLRIGASFIWGISRIQLNTAALALNADNANPAQNDVRAILQVQDLFIPGFTASALYSPIDEFDIAGWYKYQAPMNAKGDFISDANYFTPQVAAGNSSGTKGTDTSYSDCGYGKTGVCGNGNNASVKVTLPMEAKLGFRYHKPRVSGTRTSHVRDPMAQDVFDLELDVTWSNNSAFDSIAIRFPGDANGNGVIPVNGIAGGTVPPVADVKTGFKDVFGARLGGDYNIVPDTLAIRAGGFGETNGQDPQYQNIVFAGAARVGFGVGGTYRLHFGSDEEPLAPNARNDIAPSDSVGSPAASDGGPSLHYVGPTRRRGSALEFSVGYGHIFFAVENQGAQDRTAPGLAGLAGVACNPAGNNVVPTPAGQSPNVCSDGKPKYRTNWPVNLGTIWNSVNTINVGVAYRF